MPYKLKIAILVTTFPKISETFVIAHIVELIRQGHDVDVYAKLKGDLSKVHEDVYNYSILSRCRFKIEVPLRKSYRICRALQIAIQSPAAFVVFLKTLNIFKFGRKSLDLKLFYEAVPFVGRPKYDLVHCHFGTNGNKAIEIRKLGLLQGKLITTFHGFDVFLKKITAQPAIYNQLFLKGDLFIVNSLFTCQQLVKLGAPSKKTVRIRVGLDTEKFKSLNTKQLKTNEIITVISIARLAEGKGIEYGIRAIAILIANGVRNIKYLIAGDGELFEDLNKLIKDLGLQQYVQLLGAKTEYEIIHLMDNADVFINPGIIAKDGWQEAQGLVIQEAQAMGLPVIVTNVGGMSEGMVNELTGFVVQSKDPQALAEKVKYLIAHPENRLSMGKQARDYVCTHYNNKEIYKELMILYNKILEN